MSKIQTSRPVLFLAICVFLRFGPKVETSVGVQDFWISGGNACLFDGESTCLFFGQRRNKWGFRRCRIFEEAHLPPASRSNTEMEGSSEILAAKTHPAVPTPRQRTRDHNVQGIKHNFVEKTKTGDKCRTYHRQWSQRHILLQQRPLQFSYRLVPSLRHTYSSCYPWNYH